MSLLVGGLLLLVEGTLLLKVANERGLGREGLGWLWFFSPPLVNGLAPMPFTHPATAPALAVMVFALMLADLLLRQTEDWNPFQKRFAKREL
ncbi:MAG TPA: hypothetical protein VFS21_10430 [Roseiflexaceae bacterium]|nr:hypothetical protein [Roseiflexaceae bacterium]